jgi:uncharacterized protein (DUF58 family)
MPRRTIKLPVVYYLWTFKATTRGKILGGCIILSAMAAMSSLEIPVYQLCFALAMLVLIVYAAGWLARPKFDIKWRVPETAVAGHPVLVSSTLINRSSYWARDINVGGFDMPESLRMAGEPKTLPCVAPDTSADISCEIMPLKRGIYGWPSLRVFTLFPFGLFRMHVRPSRKESLRVRGNLVVYPHFRPLRALDVPINMRYQPGGISLSSSVGESPEYIGNRQYRPGDSTRHLDHRAWARTAELVVKEYQEEYYCRVALVLDTFVPGNKAPGPEGYPRLEAAISLTAAIAHALANGEYIVDLFAAGPELYVFRAGRHTAHFENVLEILACVDACHANPFQKVTPALIDELANISSVICVMLDWDAERAHLVRCAAEAGSSVKVAIVRDGPTTLPYGAAETSAAISQYSPALVRAGAVDAL